MPVTDKVFIHIAAKDSASPTIDRVKGKVERLGYSTNKTGQTFVIADRQVKDSSESMGEFGGATGAAGMGLTAMAGYIAAAGIALYALKRVLTSVTGTLRDFLQSSVETAATFEQMEAQLGVLLGTAKDAEGAFGWIKDFAKRTPFELEEVTAAFIQLTAFGIEATKKLEMLGDVAAAARKPLQQVIEAFNMLSVGRVGEAIESLGRLGVAVRKLPELEFDARGALITPLEEAIPIIEKFMVDKFGGTMAAMADTAAGGWVNILDLVTQIKAMVGDMLLPYIREIQKDIISLFTAILNEGDSFVRLIEMLGPAIEWNLIKPIRIFLQGLYVIFMDIAGWAESLAGILEEVDGLFNDLRGTQDALGEGKVVYEELTVGLNTMGRAVAGVLEPMRILAQMIHGMATKPVQEWGEVAAVALEEFERLGEYIRTGRKVEQKAPWTFGFEMPEFPGMPEAEKPEEIKQKAILALDEFELRRREYEEKRHKETIERAIEDAKKLAEIAKEYAEEVAEAYRKSFRKIIDVDIARGSGEALRDGIKEGLNAAIFEGDDFWSAFANIGKSYLQRVFNNLFDWVLNMFGGLLSGIGQGAGQGGGILGALGGFFGGIFGFQHGAVVEGSRHGVPAMIGEHFTPEAVTPFNLSGFNFYMSEALSRIPEAFDAARAMFSPPEYDTRPIVIFDGSVMGDFEIYEASERGKALSSRIYAGV